MTITAEMIIQARSSTAVDRNAIQGFLYENGDGHLHVIRNVRDPDKACFLWSKHADKKDYDKVHQEMMDQIELFKAGVLANKLNSLARKKANA